jgi:hypothetical protein
LEPLNRARTADGATQAQLIELLSSATPTTLPDSQKRSSLEAILAPRPERIRWGLQLGRPALVFAFLLLVAGASAAATLGARWIAERTPAVDVTAPRIHPPARPTHTRSRPILVVPIPHESQADAPIVELPKPSASPLRSHAGHGESPAALMAAVKALRQDHNPARANRLLHAYLRRYPHGSLSEEARALLIEAARAQSSPNTAELANEYLRLYPNGRFRSAAEKAAGRSDP